MEKVNFNPEYLAKIAKVCHQANKAFCEANDDNSQKDWEQAEACILPFEQLPKFQQQKDALFCAVVDALK